MGRWFLAGAAALLVLLPRPTPAGVSEEWYVLRGRSNMRIGNYRAAIEAWQKALEANPGNREASRALVSAYERNGETDRAVAQADQHLARFPDDADLAFQQARTLGWDRYAYRRRDAVKYYRMGLARRDDPARRHELARLLARDRATAGEAIAEYRLLLAREPGNRAWKDEYLEVLQWDPRNRGEAIDELTRRAGEEGGGSAEQHLRIARLAASDPARHEQAVEHYRQAVALRPDDRKLRLELARNLLRDGRRRGEAIEAFRDAVEASPNDRALRLEYARLLAGEPSRRGDAIAEYDRALAGVGPGAQLEARIERAELLASDERRRDQAAEAYAALAREVPANGRVRLGYGRLLGGKRETSAAAVAQYERAAAARPRSAEAHVGLARAYAWEGDRDRALDHADRALELDPRQPEVARLRDDLRRGREPSLAIFQRTSAQQAGEENLVGLAFGARAARDLSPYARAELDAGGEWLGSEGRSTAGGLAALRVEGRPSRSVAADGAVAWRGVRPGAAGVLGAAGLRWRGADPDPDADADASRGADLGWRVRVERTAREDSWVSLAGAAVTAGRAAQQAGVATEHRVAAGYAWAVGGAALDLSAEGGAVTHVTSRANPFGGAAARLGTTLLASGPLSLRGALALRLLGYGEDHSALPTTTGATPGPANADGYFSPQLLVAPGAEATLLYDLPLRHRIELGVRPAGQLVRDRNGTTFQLAGDLRLGWSGQPADRIALWMNGLAGRAGGSYQRVEVEVGAALLF